MPCILPRSHPAPSLARARFRLCSRCCLRLPPCVVSARPSPARPSRGHACSPRPIRRTATLRFPLPLHFLGLGDDDGTLEDDFAAWRKALWVALEARHPALAGSGDAKAQRHARASLEEEGRAPAAAYAVEVAPKGTAVPPPPRPGKAPFSSHNPYLARAVRALL